MTHDARTTTRRPTRRRAAHPILLPRVIVVSGGCAGAQSCASMFVGRNVFPFDSAIVRLTTSPNRTEGSSSDGKQAFVSSGAGSCAAEARGVSPTLQPVMHCPDLRQTAAESVMGRDVGTGATVGKELRCCLSERLLRWCVLHHQGLIKMGIGPTPCRTLISHRVWRKSAPNFQPSPSAYSDIAKPLKPVVLYVRV